MRTWIIAILMAVLTMNVSAQETRQDQLRLENEAWSSLSIDARRVIGERAKYIYRINEELIVDVYEMFHWADEAKKNIVPDKYVYGTRRATSYTYEHDAEFWAYYSEPGYSASFWYRGVLLNDRSNWHDPRLSDIEEAINSLVESYHATHGASKTDYDNIFAVHMDAMMPRFVVVDPLIKRNYETSSRKDELFDPRVVPEGFVLKLGGTAVGVFSNGSQFHTLTGGGSFRTPDIRFDAGFFEDGGILRKGQPSVDRFIMAPVGMTDEPDTVTGFGARYVLYEAQDLRQYQMTPKAVALAFVNGELGFEYRELERVGGTEFRCHVKTLGHSPEE